jgi:hypothetical protein
MDRKPRLRDSISTLRLWFLAGGTLFVITALTILALLWTGAAVARAQGEPGETWTIAINRGWAPVTVTVCAAVIRMVISIQAGVTMSMMASVLLEQRGVRLADSAFLSLVRAVSVQPLTLMLAGGRSIWEASGIVGLSMTVVTCLLAIMSTLTSSI